MGDKDWDLGRLLPFEIMRFLPGKMRMIVLAVLFLRML